MFIKRWWNKYHTVFIKSWHATFFFFKISQLNQSFKSVKYHCDLCPASHELKCISCLFPCFFRCVQLMQIICSIVLLSCEHSSDPYWHVCPLCYHRQATMQSHVIYSLLSNVTVKTWLWTCSICITFPFTSVFSLTPLMLLSYNKDTSVAVCSDWNQHCGQHEGGCAGVSDDEEMTCGPERPIWVTFKGKGWEFWVFYCFATTLSNQESFLSVKLCSQVQVKPN